MLVSNHISYLDFIFAGLAALPQKRLVRFMAKESVFRHKVSGPLMRGMKHIPVDRQAGRGRVPHALESLRSGEIIGVFPEATISQSFTLKSFKSGAARLAQEAGVPLIPMALWGTQRMWTKGRPRNFRRSHIPITIRVGEPMEAPDRPVRGRDHPAAARAGAGAAGGRAARLSGAPEGRERHLVGAGPSRRYGPDARRGPRARLRRRDGPLLSPRRAAPGAQSWVGRFRQSVRPVAGAPQGVEDLGGRCGVERPR